MRRRKHRPISVERDAALILLGLDPDNVEWDHDPPLGLREQDPETGLYTPDENDPRYLVPRATADHRIKTNGTAATVAGGDIHKIAKAKRLARATAEFQARAGMSGQPKREAAPGRSQGRGSIPKRANPWPAKGTRKIRSKK